MESPEAKTAAAVTVAGLVILLVILWLTLGLTRTFFLIAGIDFAVILVTIIWVVVRCTALADRRRMSMARRTAIEGEELRLEYSFLRKVAGLPTKFRYEVLEVATDNFRALIGRGSSASVYKGILDDGTAVAVKRIEGGEYGDREFRSEVSAIASVQHVNLVRLLGYCIVPGGARFLVYEFMPNGSLDKWIFPSESRRGYLTWPLRYKAAIDVAKALAYLQQDCRSRVLHLDVKPENILLDEGFRALVSDFGLSKLMGKDESRVVTTVRGTRGYLAPEWVLGSGVSEKCDVYSYGMVLLEMVGGRRNIRLVEDGEERSERKWSYFPRIVMEKVREGRVMELVDVGVAAEERQVRNLVYVALWCIQERAQLRPNMARVVDMLEGRIPVEAPPETEMFILDLLSDEHVGPRIIYAAGGAPLGQSERHLPAASMQSFSMTSILSGR